LKEVKSRSGLAYYAYGEGPKVKMNPFKEFAAYPVTDIMNIECEC
jgi:hypothetical protein